MKLSYFNLLFFNDDEEVATDASNVEESTTQEPEWLGDIVGKYDKEDFTPTSKQELVELMEMGRYYRDKGKNKLDSLKSEQSKIDFMNNLIKEQGYDNFDTWKGDVDVARKNDAIEKIANEKGFSLEDAREFYEGRNAKEQINAMTAKENETNSQIKAREAEVSKFFNEYSDLKTEDLPKEVLDNFDKGQPLKEAYLEYSFKEAQDKLKQIEKIKTNGDVSPGSLSGMQSKEKVDIKNMSKEDFKAYTKAKLAESRR